MNDNSNQIRSALDQWSNIIFSNEAAFLKRFVPWMKMNDYPEIINVAFNSESVKINFLLFEGQHVTDSYKLDDVLEWMETV